MLQNLKKYPLWTACFLSITLVSIYWTFIASDRYVSEANVVLESPQIAPPQLTFSSLLTGTGTGSSDMLLLRDYLLSVDMLKKIDTALDFRSHYADKDIDFFSRLYADSAFWEEVHEYYLARISVELDDYAQVLRIKVSAFTPEMAQKMAVFLLEKGEEHMNLMGQRLAEEQVRFLELQVNELKQRFSDARQQLLDYQNKKGLVSPTGTVESLSAVVAGLEAQLTELKAKRSTLVSFQSETSPEVVRINTEIKSLSDQIELEHARMAQQSGDALNVISAEYQTLELDMLFAKESYSGALAALENTRIEAARKLKQVSILQEPTLPEYPIEPERLHNSVMFAVVVIFLALIGQMFVMIVKEHRD